jgi:hypothetical protein
MAGISAVLKRETYPELAGAPEHNSLTALHIPVSRPLAQHTVPAVVQLLLFLTQSRTVNEAGLLIFLSLGRYTITGPVVSVVGGRRVNSVSEEEFKLL